tara:strand:- start:4805 stop:5155 length:351 start_codon:yes stop_codon:yes gene_type:complete
MKATELRIGNYLTEKFSKKEYPIYGVRYNRVFFGEDNFGPVSDMSPITLNEEWLLKFGFKSMRGQTIGYFKGSFRLLANPSVVWIKINQKNKYIYHVHQLQNLYFALTGEELTLTI